MTCRHEIVELRRAHLDQMVAMREATLRLHAGLLPHRFVADVTARDTRRMLRHYLRPLIPLGRRRRWSLGWVEDQLRGYVLFESGVERAGIMTLSRDFVVVTDIAVDPAWRGRGIADELLGAVYERTKPARADDLVAHVWGANGASAALFERNGFSVEYTLYARRLDQEGNDGG